MITREWQGYSEAESPFNIFSGGREKKKQNTWK